MERSVYPIYRDRFRFAKKVKEDVQKARCTEPVDEIAWKVTLVLEHAEYVDRLSLGLRAVTEVPWMEGNKLRKSLVENLSKVFPLEKSRYPSIYRLGTIPAGSLYIDAVDERSYALLYYGIDAPWDDFTVLDIGVSFRYFNPGEFRPVTKVGSDFVLKIAGWLVEENVTISAEFSLITVVSPEASEKLRSNGIIVKEFTEEVAYTHVFYILKPEQLRELTDRLLTAALA